MNEGKFIYSAWKNFHTKPCVFTAQTVRVFCCFLILALTYNDNTWDYNLKGVINHKWSISFKQNPRLNWCLSRYITFTCFNSKDVVHFTLPVCRRQSHNESVDQLCYWLKQPTDKYSLWTVAAGGASNLGAISTLGCPQAQTTIAPHAKKRKCICYYF